MLNATPDWNRRWKKQEMEDIQKNKAVPKK